MTRLQYHFIYQIEEKKVIGDIHQVKVIDCTQMNFPIRSFYSEMNGEVYTLYRQGNCITVSANESSESIQ